MSVTAASLHAPATASRATHAPPPVERLRSVEPAVAPTPRVRLRVVFALTSLLMVLTGFAWLLVELGGHPVSSVRIAAEFRHLQRADLEAAIAPHLAGSFFAVEMDSVRAAARAVPWVRDVSVRRVWPGSIHVAVVEREARFRWGETGLLEDDATLFTPVDRSGFDDLPLLDGPPGSEMTVRELHERMGGVLRPLGLDIRDLRMSARGAWRAHLGNGIELVLGRDPSDTVLRRLARAFPAVLTGQVERIETIDLRYANGFAVRWKPLPVTEGQG